MLGWLRTYREFRRDVMTESRLEETIQRLVAEGELASGDADRVREALKATGHESRYVMGHLCAHWAIGLVFSFDLVPLPLGTIARGMWVAGHRVYTSASGQPERAKVHSFSVLLVSLIPFVGYFAYLIPLREVNAEAAYVYANHLAYLRGNCSLEQMLQRQPRILQRLLRGLLSPGLVQPPRKESQEPHA